MCDSFHFVCTVLKKSVASSKHLSTTFPPAPLLNFLSLFGFHCASIVFPAVMYITSQSISPLFFSYVVSM